MPKGISAATPTSFEGFPEAGFRFLSQLKRNNDRDWFRERKSEYQNLIEEPMKALVLDVASQLRRHALPLFPKDKSPVMRVYRDVRFSPDKRPFKTHVAAELRRSFSTSHALLYLHFSPEESFVAAGVWQPDRLLLRAWRDAIVAHPDRFVTLVGTLKRKQLTFEAEHSLKKSARGYSQYDDEPFAPALKLTSFVTSRRITKVDAFDKSLPKKVVDFALATRPLFEFAWAVEEVQAKAAKKTLDEREFV